MTSKVSNEMIEKQMTLLMRDTNASKFELNRYGDIKMTWEELKNFLDALNYNPQTPNPTPKFPTDSNSSQ